MPSVIDLLAKAEDFLDRFELEEGLSVCQEALSLDENNVEALQLSASFLIELGQIATAKAVLQKAISLAPCQGYEKYVALAQLSEGKESLNYYSEAAKILKSEIDRIDGSTVEGIEEKAQMVRQLSNIFCAAAELYLTDLCFEEDAESSCEGLVKEALNVDKGNPESYRVEADLRLSQNRKDEAVASLKSGLILLEGIPVEDLLYPFYDQRLAMSKVLIEVEMFEEALQLLQGLLEEDEDVIDTWYLVGLSLISLEEAEEALEAFVSALALIVRLPAEQRDEEQRSSIMEFVGKIGVDGEKIWQDLEDQMKEMLSATSPSSPSS